MPLLLSTWWGSVLVEDGAITSTALVEPTVPAVSARLIALLEGAVLPSDLALATLAAHHQQPLQVCEQRLWSLGSLLPLPAPLRDLPDRAASQGIDEGLLVAAARDVAAGRLQQVGDDRFAVQALLAHDDLTRTINLLSDRLREWHGLSAPGLAAIAPEQFTVASYAAAIVADPTPHQVAAALGRPLGLAGTPLPHKEAEALRAYGQTLQQVLRAREELEEHLQHRMATVAPMLSLVAGPVLAARLLTLGGGLGALARMPAGTLQMLGAEKAFFRHRRGEGDAPKHGVIFQHPLIHAAPRSHRGKLARALSANLSLAAKADAAGNRALGDLLQQRLQRQVERIRARTRILSDAELDERAAARRATRPRPRVGSGARGHGRREGRRGPSRDPRR